MTLRRNTRFEIMTPSGWQDFDGISVKTTDTITRIDLKNGYAPLECTPDHMLELDGELVYASQHAKSYHRPGTLVYDPVNVRGGHLYNSGDYVSHNCQFLGSSGTLIAGWKLKELVHVAPIYEKDGLFKYADKVGNHIYAITVDVSEGKGLDYSTFQVIDITAMPYQQVCTFRSNLIAPHEFAQIIFNTARTYNNAYILVEYESLGPQISDILYNDYGYEHLIFTESAGSRGKRVSTKGSVNVDKGIKMTVTVKATGCSLLKLLIEQNQLIINDWDTIQELSTFSRKNKTYAAEEGCHDDMVMPLVVFAWLSDQDYYREMTDINTLATLREKNVEAIEAELTPFGFFPQPVPVAPDMVAKHGPDWWMTVDELDKDDPEFPKGRW